MVSATGIDAKYSEALVQQLADTTAFQNAVGVATSTAAKSFIIEDASGDPADGGTAVNGADINCATATFAVVRLGDATRDDRGALLTFGRSYSASIDLILRPNRDDEPAEAFRRARNIGSDIADQIQSLFGTAATRICYGTCAAAAPVQSDEIRALAGAYIVRLAITLRDIP